MQCALWFWPKKEAPVGRCGTIAKLTSMKSEVEKIPLVVELWMEYMKKYPQEIFCTM